MAGNWDIGSNAMYNNPTSAWGGGNKNFSITDIRKKITGASYLSKFYFRIIPAIGKENSKIKEILRREKLEDIFFYASGVTVPQRAIDGENYTYSNGYRVNFPTTTSYGDGTIGINVRIDEKYENYKMFISWMDIIHSKKTGHLSFYDEYTCDIDIYQLPYNANELSTTPDRSIKDMKDFYAMIEKLDKSPDGIKGRAPNVGSYYKFCIKNCYPKTLSSIEFSHESSEKVTCLVNFAYEGIDYNPIDHGKEYDVGTPYISAPEGPSTNPTTAVNLSADTPITPSSMSLTNIANETYLASLTGNQITPTTDSFSSEEERFGPTEMPEGTMDRIQQMSDIANQANNSVLYEDRETLGTESAQQSFFVASAVRNSIIATQNHPSFDEANSPDLVGKDPTDKQQVPKIEVDPVTGRVTNMPEILDAFHNTVNDPEYASIMSEIGHDDVQLGIQRDLTDLISTRMTDDGEEIHFGSGEHSESPTNIHDEYDDPTLYNKVTSVATSAGERIQERIDGGDSVASLLVATPAINNIQNRNELVELTAMKNIVNSAHNHPSFDEANSPDLVGKDPTNEQRMPEIQIDPTTGEITNRGEIIDAYNRNAADPDYNSIMSDINVNDILDDIDRDVSVLAVQNIPVPAEIKEIDVYPPPTHKNISISHAVADNVVKLELRAQNLRDDNHQIDTEISSNDSQISTLQSEVDILEESLNDPGSSGNAGAIGAQITQKQSLINQIQQENTSLLNDKIDNEGEIADMNDLINKNIVIQNSDLSVDTQSRLHNGGQRVTVLTDIEYQNKIDAIMDDELPEEVQPTLMVALGAADLDLQHKKIYGTPAEIQAAQAEYDSLIEVEVNDGFPE